MKKKRERRKVTAVITGVAAVVALACGTILTACNGGSEDQTKILEVPTNLQIKDEYLTWDEVEDAESYVVEINGEEYTTPTNSLDIMEITNEVARYKFTVCAVGNHETTYDSEWSEEIKHSVYEAPNLVFKQLTDGNYEVSAVSNTNSKLLITGKLIIPSEYNGRRVTSIAYSGFSHCKNIKSIYIPDSVETIDKMAFYGCESVTRIRLSKSIDTISNLTFGLCNAIKEFEMPSSITEIGDKAFANCAALEKLTLNEGLLTLGEEVFKNCDSLTSLVLPCSVQNLSPYTMKSFKMAYVTVAQGENANLIIESSCIIRKSDGLLFSGCAESVIPDYVKIIGKFAFEGCLGLKKIVIPYGVTEIQGSAFMDCHNVREIYIPASVKKIGSGAFYGCCYSSAVIPADVEEIGTSAFSGHCMAYSIFDEKPEFTSPLKDKGNYRNSVFAYEEDGKYPYVYSTVLMRYGFKTEIYDNSNSVGLITPCRQGYTFLGWATEEGSDKVVYKPQVVSVEHKDPDPNGSYNIIVTSENVLVTYIHDYNRDLHGTVLYAVWQKNN